MRLIWVGLIFTMFFSTCQKTKEDRGEVVASVYERNLYRTDLEDILYEGISYEDSVLRSKVYIDKWIRSQLLVQQAENNLDPSQLDFTRRIEEYRNSLIVNKYENELINQKLDTEVTDDQIYEYYNNNNDEFRLNRDIVKIATVTLSNDCKKKWLFTKLFRNYDSLMVDSVVTLADEYALSYDMNLDKWYTVDEIVDTFNLTINDNKSFLTGNVYYILKDEETYTLIRIYDYKLIGDLSPCELEVDKIKYIILNNRKNELLRNLHEDIYTKARQDQAFVIY